MFNLSVKLSILSEPYELLSPQVFLDKPPHAALMLFKRILPQRQLNMLAFALSDEAILLILENEFEVDVAKRRLLFTKPQLDPQSWLYANGLADLPPVSNADELDSAVNAVWHTVKAHLPYDISNEDRHSRYAELKTLIQLYAVQYPQPDIYRVIATPAGQHKLLSYAVAQALYKTDAAKALFGRDALYTSLWQQKQTEYLYLANPVAHRHQSMPA